ncbi:MAG: pyridoxal phosphate-dependent aminotransferase [Bacteroidota bacterium]|jgi:aspartate aminotransferase
MQPLADRIYQINEPQTIAMAKLSRELAAQGHDVINLSLGEPDFPTPQHIKDAAKAAIDANFSYYTPVAGIPELREAISAKFKRENNLDFAPAQTLVSTGAKQSIMNVILALINPGDEVIIPTPYWVSYSEMVKLVGGVPVFVHADIKQQYKITPDQLTNSITSKSKAFIFSSPCNPTGSVYTKYELQQLAGVFEKHPGITIVSDEIYEHIRFTGSHESIAQFDSLKDRVVVVNGMSKGFAMTGWRIGYIGAPLAIVQACEKIQGQFTSGTNSIAQKAAVAALNGTMQPTEEMCAAYKRRGTLVKQALDTIEGVVCNEPEGAFYVFPDISRFLGVTYGSYTLTTATDLCLYLLHEAHVSLVTGEAFGAPSCVRISYATSDAKLQDAMQRIHTSLNKLK